MTGRHGTIAKEEAELAAREREQTYRNKITAVEDLAEGGGNNAYVGAAHLNYHGKRTAARHRTSCNMSSIKRCSVEKICRKALTNGRI